jgi:beta-lactamase regulating signal transducer with metallopeptidase domain
VICLAGDSPTAFCAGAFRLRILLSEGVVRQLGKEELDAVLLHEKDHVQRHEPLVRAANEAAAQVFF